MLNKILGQTKKGIGVLTALFTSIPLVAAASSFERNPFIDQFISILNSLALIIGNNVEVTKVVAANPGMQPWHVVSLTLILVTAIVTAALTKVKIFQDRSAPRVMIGVVFGIAACAAPGVLSLIWSMGLTLIIIAVIAFLIFMMLTIWRSGSAVSSEMGADAARAKATQYEAMEARDKAKDAYKKQDELFTAENRDLRTAQQEIQTLEHLGTDVEGGIDQILTAVTGLATLRDEGHALKIKESLQRKVGVLSAKLVHEDEDTVKLHKKMGDLKNILSAELGAVADATRIQTQVEAMFNRKKGTGPNAAQQREISSLAVTFANLKNKELELVGKIDTNIQGMKTHNDLVKGHLQDVLSKMFENDYPGAIQACNSAKSEEVNVKTATKRLKELSTELYNFEKQARDANSNLLKLLS